MCSSTVANCRVGARGQLSVFVGLQTLAPLQALCMQAAMHTAASHRTASAGVQLGVAGMTMWAVVKSADLHQCLPGNVLHHAQVTQKVSI
jgi:predicted metal-binding membrane protein